MSPRPVYCCIVSVKSNLQQATSEDKIMVMDMSMYTHADTGLSIQAYLRELSRARNSAGGKTTSGGHWPMGPGRSTHLSAEGDLPEAHKRYPSHPPGTHANGTK